MKKLFTTVLLIVTTVVTYGQFCYYQQSFENPITGITSTGNPGFNANTLFFHDGVQSYHGTYVPTDSAIATSDPVDLTNNTFVILKFWHIAKIEFFDAGTIQVSADGGATWTTLTGAQYLGTSNFPLQGNKFTEAAYPAWHPGDTLTPVDSSWWREEQFDVSSILGSGTVNNAMIRFVGKDLNLNGLNGRTGWFIDEVCLLAAPCELTPPTLSQTAPVLTGTVYSLGPYTLNVYSNDASGVAGVFLFYSVNGVAQPTLPMVNPAGDSLFTAQLPGVSDGDTVCYSFYAFDASACANEIYYPAPAGTSICFVASSGITFPYCDDFDVNNLWLDSLVTGSPWELGTPNFGLTSTPHSAPNAWDISLNSAYSTGTQAYLISPVFDFGAAQNVRMSFWYNSATDNFSQDGVRMETSVNGSPWSILTTAQDPSATNWYNIPSLSSSGTPGWGGNSNGWQQAKFNMSSFNNAGGVQMRFIFQSANFSTGDGFSIDDFCLIQPPPEDMGVDKVIEPFPSAGAGTTSNAIVRVRNYGTSVQTTFDVAYSINGVLQGTVPYTGAPLAPNDTAIVTITPTFTVPSLGYDFCAWTILPTDADNTNDSLCVQRQGVPVVTLSYCNDFDISGADWTSIPSPIGNTVWELGTPAYGSTSTAYSNPNSWDINLNTAYENQAEATLVSPYFDFSNVANVDLSFWQNRNCETNWDGVRIEYSDNANPWQVLGSVGSGVNWYTNASINSSQLPAWDGTTNGNWVKSSYNMSAFNNIGLVQLQFIFTSDFSVIWDGFSIDNFCLHVPQPIDVGVDSILTPTTNSGALQNSDVTVRVRNFGSTPQSTFDVYYTFNGGPPVGPFSYTGPALAPNDVALITIPPQITIPQGLFTVCAYTDLATDMDHTNDTICKQCKGIPVLALNYCDNFDAGGTALDWTPVTLTAGTQWQLGAPNWGATNSAHSAPNAWDINLNSGYTTNANAELLSPFFDLGTAVNAELSFWQNRNTQAFNDGCRLDISVNGGLWQTLGFVNDPLSTNWYTVNNIFISGQPAWDGTSGGWQKSAYQMINYNNIGLIQLKFVFRSAAFSTGDGMSIDDFCLRIPPPIDAGTVSIDAPTGGLVIGNLYFPTVTIKNYGSADIDTIPVTYAVNGVPVATQIYYPTLTPNQSTQVSFTTGFNALSGGFDICAYTEMPGDGDNFNDTTCVQMVGVPTLIPTYTDNFDGVNNGWTTNNVSGSGSQWELGTPNWGTTNTAYSNPNSWDVNLNNAYTNQANCELISPFFDFLNVVNAHVSFWYNTNCEANWDGMRLDYSADGGATWNTLGSVGCTSCLNWYTKATINSSGKPAWDGNSGGWKFAKDSDLVFLNGNPAPVIFKYIFTSDFSVTGDGVSIDDFQLYKPISITAATDLVYPANNILTPGPQYIMGRYINKGTTPMTKVLLTLEIDGVLHVTDTINPIPGGQLNWNVSALHQFSLPWNAAPGLHTFCIYTSLPNDSVDLNTADDTTCMQYTVFDSTSIFPYCTDFESGPQWVALNSVDYTQTSSWQIGTPVKTNIIGSHSGANCWVTNLVSEYPNLDNSSLFSPVFNVEANKCYELSFWHNADMDLFNDGGAVEYSIDSAKSWIQLGQGGDYLNWYNSIYIAAFGGPPAYAGWTGLFGGWLQSSHNWTAPQSGQVIFRWRFASDQTNTADGWAIDDVCFKEIAAPCVTAVGTVDANLLYLYQNLPNPTNGVTTIGYSLPKQGKVTIEITNLVGQVIAQPVNGSMSEGKHVVEVSTSNLAPGVYYYTLRFEDRKIVRKMIVTK